MISQHVTSLEISRRLEELGFAKPSLFSWVYSEKSDTWECWFSEHISDFENKNLYVSAYVATELLEELPSKIYDKYGYKELEITKVEEDENIYYKAEYARSILSNAPSEPTALYNTDKSLACLLARMWIYLKENGLIYKGSVA